jgi:hypothetical protein
MALAWKEESKCTPRKPSPPIGVGAARLLRGRRRWWAGGRRECARYARGFYRSGASGGPGRPPADPTGPGRRRASSPRRPCTCRSCIRYCRAAGRSRFGSSCHTRRIGSSCLGSGIGGPFGGAESVRNARAIVWGSEMRVHGGGEGVWRHAQPPHGRGARVDRRIKNGPVRRAGRRPAPPRRSFPRLRVPRCRRPYVLRHGRPVRCRSDVR